MNRRPHQLLWLLLVTSCENAELPRVAPAELQTDLSAREEALRPTRPRLSGGELIAQLDRRDARALCEQAGRVLDLCAAAARREFQPAGCAATLASCRAQDPGPTTDCTEARFDFPEPCTATVDDYLHCVERWSAELSCTYESFRPATPPECLPLLQKCPFLEREFGAASSIVPRCDPDSPPRVDDSDDIVGLDCGRPLPARMVTLGDSIAACYMSIFGYSQSCAPTLVSEYLRAQHAPDLEYRSLAVPGAVTAGLLRQASLVPPGPGHLLVWIYMGGNDLLGCRRPTLPETQACTDALLASLPATWRDVFAYFDDVTRFPDGVTFMLNTQYSLYDQCTHPLGPERGAFSEALIQRFNREVIMQAALDRPNVVAVDQYPDFLGHANNANRQGCPHCSRDDNAPWLFDGTHPNDRGDRQIAAKWKPVIDRAYGGCQ